MKNHFVTLFVFVLCTSTALAAADAELQKFAIEAEDVTAVLGTTIQLPCRVVGRQGQLQWTKDDFGLGPHRNLSAFDRYEMTGSDEEGDYTLRIVDAQLEDDARYQCQVSPGPDGQPGIRSRFVRVTVLAPAEAPRITQGDFLLVTEHNEIEVECVAKGGKPAADLTWIDGQGNGITHGVRYSAQPDEEGRFDAKSVLRLRVQKHHHNTTLLCHSQNAADRHFKTAEVKLEVKYAPKMKLVLEATAAGGAGGGSTPRPERLSSGESGGGRSSSGRGSGEDYRGGNEETSAEMASIISAIEGHDAHFLCQADANPADITYKWFVNNELVVGDYTTEMVIHNVNRSHHLAAVKCEATNDIGFNEASMVLKVKYPPLFKQPLRSVEADLGERVRLHCDVDGQPLEIVWVHDPTDREHQHPRVVGTNATLALKVSDDTAGRYYCKASVPGYPEIRSEAVVYVKRAPQIESARQQFGARGDTVRVRCAAFSVPKARHVSWSFGGRELQTSSSGVDGGDYGVEEDHTARGIVSTLVIRRSEDGHFGRYNCTVVNDYGVDVLQIELVQQNNFQYLMIIVGATAGLIILVIVVVLVLCIKQRGQAAHHEHDMRSSKEKAFGSDMMSEKQDQAGGCWNKSGGQVGGGGSSGGSGGSSAALTGDGGSSHSSDYKPDIKAGSSESDYSIASTNIADSTLDFKEMRRNGTMPLAEPIELPLNYRHSIDYADSYYPPKYAPPAQGSSILSHHQQQMHHHQQQQVPTISGSPATQSYNNSYVTRTDYARYCAPQQQQQHQFNQHHPQQQQHSAAYASPPPPLPIYSQQQQQSPMQAAMGMQVATAVPMPIENGLPGARSSLIV